MRVRVLCTVLALSLAHVLAVTTVISNDEELWSFDALVANRFIGPQTRQINLTAPVVVSADWVPRDCDSVEGKVVAVLGNDDVLLDLANVREAMSQLEACGALAVVKAGFSSWDTRSRMGNGYYATRADCCRDVENTLRVPLLVAWHTEIEELAVVADQGRNLTLHIDGADRNSWVEDMAHSDLFLVFSRVLMPTIDICVGLVALRALALHTKAYVQNRGKVRKGVLDGMRAYLVIASLMQVAGCAVRAFYCIIGPFVCNARLLLSESLMLLNISPPLQLPTIFVVSAMLRRITSVRRNVSPPSKLQVASLVAVTLAMWALFLLAGRALSSNNNQVPVFFSYVASVAVCVCAFALFVGTGVPFLLQMRQAKHVQQQARIANASTVSAIRTRIATSIVLGSVGLLLQTVSITLFPVFGTPQGFASTFTLYYLGFAITALFHSLAFAPLLRVSAKPNAKSAPQIFLLNFGQKESKADRNVKAEATQLGFQPPVDLQEDAQRKEEGQEKDAEQAEEEGKEKDVEDGKGVEQAREEGQEENAEEGKGVGQQDEGQGQAIELASQPPRPDVARATPAEPRARDDADADADADAHGDGNGGDGDGEWGWEDFKDEALVNDPSMRRESSGASRSVIVSATQAPGILRRKVGEIVMSSFGPRGAQQRRQDSGGEDSGARHSRGKQFFLRFASAK